MSTVSGSPAERDKTLPPFPVIRLLWGLTKMRLWGDFADVVAYSQSIGAGLRSNFIVLRMLYLHRPEYVEAVCIKNDKFYRKPRGLLALRRFIGNGLLTSEGTFHLRQRRMIQPAFHKKRIETYAQCMVGYTRDRCEGWRDGQHLDVHTEMMSITLTIIAKTMFNAEVADDAEKVAHALDLLQDYQHRYELAWVGKLFDLLPLPSTRKLHRGMAELDEIIYRIIDEHCRAEEDSGDLLSMLLQAKAEEDGNTMSGQQLRDECLTLFLAGHETTAVLLTWTWMLLSQNPEVEAKLHEEIDRVLAGREPAVADLEHLVFSRYVVTEAMRLYPPAYGFGREAIEDNQIGPFKIHKGEIVIFSPFIMHRQPEWYPDPERFDPDRWRPERSAHLHKFAYFPFGGGSRKCIGDQFAWMEGTLLLATIAQRWSMRVSLDHKGVPDPKITLRPRDGMPVVLTQRQAATDSHPEPATAAAITL